MSSVVLTCHEPRLDVLPRALSSIDAQTVPFAQKVLVLDRVERDLRPPGWDVVHVDHGGWVPSLRDGLFRATDPWVACFDSDNEMHPNFHEEMLRSIEGRDVGFAYCHFDLEIGGWIQRTAWRPRFDRWQLSRWNFVDTASLWRTDLAQRLYGVDDVKAADYALALDVVAEGFEGVLAAPTQTLVTFHHSPTSNLNSQTLKQAAQSALSFRRPLIVIEVDSPRVAWDVSELLQSGSLPRRTRLVLTGGCADLVSGIFERCDLPWREVPRLLEDGFHEFVVTSRPDGILGWTEETLLELFVPLFMWGFRPSVMASTVGGVPTGRTVLGQPLLGGPWGVAEAVGQTTAWVRQALEQYDVHPECVEEWDVRLAAAGRAAGLDVLEVSAVT